MDRMPGAPAGVTSPPVFVDGFGARYETFDAETGDPDDLVEVLAFSPHLVEAPDFVATLSVRVARLGGVRHALFAHARRLEQPTEDSLLLVSDRVPGWRLADVLDVAEQNNLTLDIAAILNLMRQLIPTVALFARHQRELAVGTIGPEHLILTAEGHLVLTEYALGSAIEKLSLSREVLWRRLRVASTPGPVKIWPRSDALGIGIVFLSLLHGRRLGDAEFPDALGDLLVQVQEWSDGEPRPVSPKLTTWLAKALQLPGHIGFQTPADAQVAYEELLLGARDYSTNPAALDAFIEDFRAVIEPPAPPARQEQHAPTTIEVDRVPPPVVAKPVVVAPVAETPVIETPVVEPPVVETPVVEAPPLNVDELVSSVVIRAREPEPESEPPPPKPVVRPPVARPPVVERKRPAQPEPVVAAAPTAGPIDDSRSRFPIDLGEWSGKALAALAAAAALEFIMIVWLWNGSSASLAGDGELVVQSRPTGATVTLDDKDLGTTPVTVRLSPGTYTLKVQIGAGEPRVIPVQIKPGVQTAQYLELRGDR
jgi:PEGA domain-containing protein